MSISVDLRVLELVCSRICHDLVSPVGAINNGIELIREMADDSSANRGLETEAVELIAHSAEQGSRRLRVLRLAYGAAGADAPWEELRSSLDQYFEGTRVSLVWPPDGAKPSDPAKGMAKMLVNAVLLAADALSQNGVVTIELRTDGLAITAKGKSPALDAERAAALVGRTAAADLDPRSIHAYVTGRMAIHYGIRLATQSVAPDRLEISLSGGA